ncbi:MAG: hypothetical protein JWQ90_4729 [Hydrocarboniphaga sp.]|uniref:hypothetical protein n=1 Tax=Hydrocarboniphaga sp. TaxID=2033016 RepID=UPI002639150D|nr:hypothetical protein [Hydrocarboniphaga sp.]MDB5972279.1 hypothetical protein [Hydrocarboniphaga sp.]
MGTSTGNAVLWRGLLGAAALLGASEAWAAARTGYDPLSTDEQSLALKMALADARITGPQGQSKRSEVLMVERHQEDKAAFVATPTLRRADVYIYLYDSDRLLQAVVNLPKNAVDSVITAQKVQLPPTETEGSASLTLALGDSKLGPQIRDEYFRSTGRKLTSASDLVSDALVFRSDAHPGAAGGAARDCGLHRCTQLLLTSRDGILVNVLPIVDLSRGAAVGMTSFAP